MKPYPLAELHRIWDAKGVPQEKRAEILADVDAKSQPGAMVGPFRIEQTEAGAQTVISDTPARVIPTAGLKPKRAQNDSPLALEMQEIDAKQIKLF